MRRQSVAADAAAAAEVMLRLFYSFPLSQWGDQKLKEERVEKDATRWQRRSSDSRLMANGRIIGQVRPAACWELMRLLSISDVLRWCDGSVQSTIYSQAALRASLMRPNQIE